MSLEEAAYFGQAVAGLAVLASLVFVGFQIRQNTRFQKRSVVDALSTAITCLNVAGMESPVLGEALAVSLEDWDAGTREQRIIAHYYVVSYLKLAENAWYQRQSGVLEPAQWAGWETMVRAFYHSPGIRGVWWPQRRGAFSPSFRAYLEGSAEPKGFGRLNDLFGRRA
jgi:hypothetical protein